MTARKKRALAPCCRAERRRAARVLRKVETDYAARCEAVSGDLQGRMRTLDREIERNLRLATEPLEEEKRRMALAVTELEGKRAALARELAELRKAPPPQVEPIAMLLWCPVCNERHFDVGVHAITPHRTHTCQACGMCWAPAAVATLGVRFLPGTKNGDPKP